MIYPGPAVPPSHYSLLPTLPPYLSTHTNHHKLVSSIYWIQNLYNPATRLNREEEDKDVRTSVLRKSTKPELKLWGRTCGRAWWPQVIRCWLLWFPDCCSPCLWHFWYVLQQFHNLCCSNFDLGNWVLLFSVWFWLILMGIFFYPFILCLYWWVLFGVGISIWVTNASLLDCKKIC